MFLLIEILLTAYASVRLERAKLNWFWAVVPTLAIGLIGFVLGFIAGLLGIAASYLVAMGLILDVILILCLGAICLFIKPVA